MVDIPMVNATTAVSSGISEESNAPPNTTNRITSAANTPTNTDNTEARPLRVGDGLAAQRDVDVGAVGRLGCGNEVVGVTHRDVGRDLVPRHGGEGDGTVRADLKRCLPVR